MDVTAILQAVKGKVLDAAHFELLKHAYELQEENINQLKNNNEAIKESNLLLQEKLKKLEARSAELEEKLSEAASVIKRLEPPEHKEDSLSDTARSVLALFKSRDVTDMYQNTIVRLVEFSRIEVEAALEELSSAKLIDFAGASFELGVNYYLTSKGKHIVLNEF